MKYLLGFFALVVSNLQAQQLPQFSQYFADPIAVNPAVAGSQPFVDLKFHQRVQWVGFEDAPVTSLLSGHGRIGEAHGVGGYFFNDMAGPVRRTGINTAYSYAIPVASEVYLRMGLSFSIFQYAMDGSKMDLYEDGDALIDASTQSQTWVPDAGFGMYLETGDFFVGLSALQLPQYQVNVFSGSDLQGYLNREHHFYFLTGYTHQLDDTWQIRGTGYLNYMVNNPMQYTIHVAGIYNEMFELGVAYRNSDAIVSLLGFYYNGIHVMYSYDWLISTLSGNAAGSHEITLGYAISTGKDVKKRYNIGGSGKRK